MSCASDSASRTGIDSLTSRLEIHVRYLEECLASVSDTVKDSMDAALEKEKKAGSARTREESASRQDRSQDDSRDSALEPTGPSPTQLADKRHDSPLSERRGQAIETIM